MHRRLVVIAAALVITSTVWLVIRSSPTTRRSENANDDWIADSRFDFNASAKTPDLPEEDRAV